MYFFLKNDPTSTATGGAILLVFLLAMDFFLGNIMGYVLANVLLNGFEWAFKEHPFVTLCLLGMAALLVKLYLSPAT
jgi:hypothetical protein